MGLSLIYGNNRSRKQGSVPQNTNIRSFVGIIIVVISF